jgi:hypothetical protein
MRIRAVTATGDYTFGANGQNFLVNSIAAVGLAISDRLALFTGQWYLDLTAGTPWFTQVIGYGTKGLYDQMLQGVILGTQGVLAILAYSSVEDATTRTLSVAATVQTIYGKTTVTNTVTTGGFGYNFGGDFGN